jgi:hypothetical protein
MVTEKHGCSGGGIVHSVALGYGGRGVFIVWTDKFLFDKTAVKFIAEIKREKSDGAQNKGVHMASINLLFQLI